jgi:FtsZ-binding cell division protein ZapB
MYLGPHGRSKPSENRPHKNNLPLKDYEDEQELYQVRHGDAPELKELKGKLRVLVSKLATGKKERDQLQRSNESLQKEVLQLQNNLRHMVVGFANTSSAFPMVN